LDVLEHSVVELASDLASFLGVGGDEALSELGLGVAGADVFAQQGTGEKGEEGEDGEVRGRPPQGGEGEEGPDAECGDGETAEGQRAGTDKSCPSDGTAFRRGS
jgi:hypothetical protein